MIKDIAEPGSIVKETELRTVVRRFFQQLEAYTEDGLGFKCEFFTAYPVLTGSSENPEEQWDSDKHSIYISIKPGKLLKEATAKIQMELAPHAKESAVIEAIEDLKSGTVNDQLTPGDLLRITGSQLKIYDSPTGQGLRFVQKSTGQEYPASLIDNFPSQLLARIPDDLPADTYMTKIVNTKHGNSITMRTTLSEIELNVA